FFVIVVPHPPISTLFPYTTLFRSDYCKEKDLVVIGDIKRGDIGSTSAAYAVGHLGRVQVGSRKWAGFDEDFATVNPYLGSDGVKDRKSTRLNSSHVSISYAVFCLK